MICDLEAGIGAVVRTGEADLVLVVAEPSAKSIEVARRAAEIAEPDARVIVVANRIRDVADVELIRAGVGGHELVPVPEEPAIERADRAGVAPIDAEPEAPGVRAIVALAKRLAAADAPSADA